MGLLLGGCSGDAPSGPTAGAPAASAVTVATADDIRTLDTALAFDTWSTAVVHACTRRLVDYDAAGNLVPDLAERWEESDGGRVYTFHLREARYADGSPITAEHFRHALQRVRSPDTGSPGAAFYTGIAALEAPDARTLVVRLKTPEPTLLNLMGLTFAAPVPPGHDPARPAPSGPYRVESYDPGAEVVLAANPEDTRRTESAARLLVQLRVDEALQWTRFQSGEVDLLPAIPSAEYARVITDPGRQDNVVRGTVNQTWYFGMNVTRRPWNDARVRRAALLAMNRERHLQLSPSGELAHGILPPRVPAYDPGRRLPGPDLAAARRLLAEAGYRDGIPESQKTVLWLASNELYQRHAEAIQSDLAAVGIPVELRPVTLSEYLSGYRTRADCWYGGWYPDFPDAGNFLEPVLHGKSIPPRGSNAAHYRSAEVDRLLDQAHFTPRGAAREGLYRQAEDALLRDLPWIPLYFEGETRLFQDGVTGVIVHPVWRQMLTGISRQPAR